MPNVWGRHPKYALFVFVVLATTFYLLDPFYMPPPPGSLPPLELHMAEGELARRLVRADVIYDKMLADRKDMIKKFGPEPEDVMMFPPDKDPWPAYTVWDFFPATYNCPHELRRVGALGDGGKWVCGLSRVEDKPDCVVYSVGINHESSFEAELLSSTSNCEVWGYDFSVSSFGPQIPSSLAHRAHFFPYGLAGSDSIPSAGDTDGHPMYTLQSLMRMNSHSHIDILKVDIESWEFETLTTLLKSYLDAGKPLPFGQLQLEIHLWDKTFEQFLGWWEMLEEAGLRPFMTEPNLVYANYNRESSAQLAELNRLGAVPGSPTDGPVDLPLLSSPLSPCLVLSFGFCLTHVSLGLCAEAEPVFGVWFAYSFLNIKGNNVFIRDHPHKARPQH
ncbi:hypothetical protein D9758_009609 [Tetrapyrgos nigripes]|uniref:Methyltransferase domain-containing protein n=1 Tax=Tetrapyrgos nigripes TaxID=182062 RepID=A0A8H5LM52_9AGAR|nr:hypothetical protein D9758_009609 [Tetrapyrgos nigripes]